MILCCGEALIDMIPATTHDGADAFMPRPGGAVHNTAIALGRLGLPTGLLTGLSRDLFGARLAGGLRASGVDLHHAIRSDRPTTLAFLHLDGAEARYSFFDENSAARMLTPADMPALPGEVAALFFGGISLATEPCGAAYAALLAANAAGRAVMLDPNIRPGVIDDEQRYRARLAQMMAQSDIVKLSDADLDWLAPGPAPLPAKVAALHADGPGLVIVTHGSAGATGFLAGRAPVDVPAPQVPVADTVGAGDTFNAGVLAHLSHTECLTPAALATLSPDVLRAALAFGARVAAVTVTRVGADPPRAADL